jgi:uncharacterized protein (TIGR02466 family)
MSQDKAAQGPTPKVEMRSLFPTPIAVVDLPGAAALNKELKRIILEREVSHPGTQHSNLGSRLTVDRQGQAVKLSWKINCWANVNRSGHGNEFHTHPGAFWSGTYYVDDGGIGQDPSLGGEFEVQDPRGIAPAMYAPMLTIAGRASASLGVSELVHPHTGMMVLFPSWLQHAVRPYQGEAERISIAFNLSL